jgi:hypothetical protein
LPTRDSRDHALLLLSKAQADKVVIDKLADDRIGWWRVAAATSVM